MARAPLAAEVLGKLLGPSRASCHPAMTTHGKTLLEDVEEMLKGAGDSSRALCIPWVTLRDSQGKEEHSSLIQTLCICSCAHPAPGAAPSTVSHQNRNSDFPCTWLLLLTATGASRGAALSRSSIPGSSPSLGAAQPCWPTEGTVLGSTGIWFPPSLQPHPALSAFPPLSALPSYK